MPDEAPKTPKEEFSTPKSKAAGIHIGGLSHNIGREYAREQTDPAELHALAEHPHHRVVEAVTENEHTSPETLKHIHQKYENHEEHSYLAREAATHQNAPEEIVNKEVAKYTPERNSYGKSLLQHPKADTKVVQKRVSELLADKELGDDEKQKVTRNFVESEHAHPKHIDFLSKHKSPEVAMTALRSKHATLEHHKEVLKNPELKPEHLQEMVSEDAEREDPDPEAIEDDPTGRQPWVKKKKPILDAPTLNQIHELHDNHKDLDKDRHHRYYGGIESELLKHPKLDPEKVKKIYQGDAKEGEEPSGRDAALSHPNMPKDVIDKAVDRHTQKDFVNRSELGELLKRPDLSSEAVQRIDAHVQKNKKDLRKYDKEALFPAIAEHPNFPREKMLKRIKEDPFAGRSALQYGDLDDEELHALIQHKTKDVAVEALKHPNIKAEHVQAAFDRKAGEVSRSAAVHPLATPEMKMSKLEEDPEALPKMASREAHPDMLKKVFEKGKDNPKVIEALQKNKNTPPEVLSDIIDHVHKAKKENQGNAWSRDRDFNFDYSLGSHPNFKEEHAIKMALDGGSHGKIAHDAVTPQGMRHILSNTEDPDTKKAAAANALENPNIDASLAKEILTGQHGPVREQNNYGGETLKVNQKPEVYTKDVVDSVLNGRQEMVPEFAVNELAKSKHLNPEDIENHIKNSFKQGTSSENEDHRKALVVGLMHNPNVKSDMLHKVLTDPKFQKNFVDHKELAKAAESAAESPNLSNEHLQDLYRNHYKYSSMAENGLAPIQQGPVQNNILDQIKDRKLTEDALKTGSEAVVEHLIAGKVGGYTANSTNISKALMSMQNPNPGVQKNTMETLHNHKNAIDDKTREELFDKYATGHPEELRDAAYPLMSEKKRVELAKGKDPREMTKLIPGLSNDAVSKLDIKPEDPDEYVEEILKHQGQTDKHKIQAAEHSYDFAKALSMHPQSSKEFYDKILEKYPEDRQILYNTASGTRWPEHADKMLHDPHVLGDLATVKALVDNDNLNIPGREDLKNLKGEQYHGLFSALATHPDTKVDTLKNILKQSPTHAQSIAENPKAKSPKLIKDLLLMNDLSVNTALAENDKVPEEIRNEIMKDPRVGLSVNKERLPPDVLHRYAEEENDPYLLNHIVTANQATRATRDIVAKKLLAQKSSGEKDGQNRWSALEFLAARPLGISPETREELALHQKNLAANIVSGLSERTQTGAAGHDEPVMSSEFANKVFEKFHDSYEVHDALLGANTLQRDPELFKKVLDAATPAELSSNFSESMANGAVKTMKGLDQRGLLDDEMLNKAYEKFHNANTGTNIIDDFIAREAGPELQNKLIDPIQNHGINKNRRLTKESVARIGDYYLKTNFKYADGANNDEKSEQAGHFALNPAVDPKTRDKVVMHLINNTDDSYWNDEYGQKLLASPSLSPESIQDVMEKAAHTPAVKSNVLMGLLKNPNIDKSHLLKAMEEGESAFAAAKNPKFRLSMLNEAHPGDQKDNPEYAYVKDKVINSLADNFHAHPEDLEAISKMDRNRAMLLKNPRLPKEAAQAMVNKMLEAEGSKDLYQSTNAKEILFSPTVGGDMFRSSIKNEGTDDTSDSLFGHAKFPPSLGMDDKAVVKEAHHYPSLKKVRDVIGMIPKDGHLDWAEFKKANQSLAGDPVIQKMFTMAPKQRLTKEQADQYMKAYPDKKDFGITFRKWDGMQRHNGKPQLVVQLNSSPKYEEALKDANVNAIHQIVRRGQYSSSHPVTPATIGWSRVDTSDPNHWFIEEVQSDYTSGLAKEIHNFIKYGGARDFKQYNADPGEINSAVNKLEQNSAGWNQALLNSIIEMAKKHGAKKLSIHSGKSKTKMNKGDASQVTHKYDRIYNKMPQEYGFQPDKYRNLPSANVKDNNGEDPIWTLHLEDEDTKKSMLKPEKLTKNVQQARDIIRRLRNGK